ncbi:MAG TPA: hypothetical protein QGI62_05065 [Anaerolineales bacterium]|jgi:hypothetical protein|nr:hypothetical protein [Anaerolineales bacterium]|tara:strand:+ start:916 stop:1116 length:201 start_codon:yes stop_codon:yes gene_type:complete
MNPITVRTLDEQLSQMQPVLRALVQPAVVIGTDIPQAKHEEMLAKVAAAESLSKADLRGSTCFGPT